MNITRQDVQELRRRFKKKGCTFDRVCGCYVNSGKQTVLRFSTPFSELEEAEFDKYLEIAKKVLSGALGNNLLELSFARGEEAAERQKYLLALKESRLKNEALLDRLYEQMIAHYENPGNYLVLLYHDIYDVPVRTRDGLKLDDSEETYAYLLCALCPVDLSRPALGYQESENRFGACQRDWIVGPPELGFVYPAFIAHGSDVNAVLYYIKTGKSSHPEVAEKVLGCIPQRTGAEEKQVFQDIITGSFGEDEEQAETALLLLQNTMSAIVTELAEDESLPPVHLTAEVITDLSADAGIPEEIQAQIEQSCQEAFGDAPPMLTTVFDAKLAAKGAQRANTIRLEQKIADLNQQLAAQEEQDAVPSRETEVSLLLPPEKAERIRTETVDGQRYLLVPLEEGETARINGTEQIL